MPFAFDFAGSFVVTIEIFANLLQGPYLEGETASAVSTFKLDTDGSLTPISVSVPTYEGAICWIVGGKKGHFDAANKGSDTISDLFVDQMTGRISVVNSRAAIIGPGQFFTNYPFMTLPRDLVVTSNGKYLYQLTSGPSNNNEPTRIFSFSIDKNSGELTQLGTTGVAAALSGVVGIATIDFK